jgi:hypothetical protein
MISYIDGYSRQEDQHKSEDFSTVEISELRLEE